MTPNPAIMRSVEQLGYRVTVGDVATQAGLNVAEANQGLLALASEAGGHLQVAESGDIVYQFPQNFRTILRNKYLQVRLQEWWKKIWGVLFYLIRISFGVLLIASIALITVTIIIIITAANSDRDGDNRSSSSSGLNFFFFPDLFWYFSPDYSSQERRRERREDSEFNFFEAVFSFLFGDGNPNANLEEHRWREIGTVIRNNQGAVVAEQIAPYLDNLGEKYQQEYEDYMLPVLVRFNGKPQVSSEGEIVYYFPDLQVKASKHQRQPVAPYLNEIPWRFSAASSGQIMLSAGLGAVNLVAALILGSLLKGGTAAAQIGGLVGFVQGIYWLLLAYGIGFLGIPLVRYFWIQWRNGKLNTRNYERLQRARFLANADDSLQEKMAFASQFAGEKVIGKKDVIYSSDTDLLEQEFEQVRKQNLLDENRE
ncbi:hypothetical protein A0J48_016290 [Sphaerospermopsis aphanizomenoides BCCUSP55]|uniref:hypothetical protein n=1 Tax=Sphaerospermopsis aphanizomenoides TaxID=459663 RepID=UPI000B050B51|nr:hypothetical protein [Sphaerospermopsis aphanizomenoides]MBK1989078.1 hypothetical protein [Sphaerospermopsis aphanizomenoides BCCUSP55]